MLLSAWTLLSDILPVSSRSRLSASTVSTLFQDNQYKEFLNPRFDKDLEKGYLQGLYGAIPYFGKEPGRGYPESKEPPCPEEVLP